MFDIWVFQISLNQLPDQNEKLGHMSNRLPNLNILLIIAYNRPQVKCVFDIWSLQTSLNKILDQNEKLVTGYQI